MSTTNLERIDSSACQQCSSYYRLNAMSLQAFRFRVQTLYVRHREQRSWADSILCSSLNQCLLFVILLVVPESMMIRSLRGDSHRDAEAKYVKFAAELVRPSPGLGQSFSSDHFAHHDHDICCESLHQPCTHLLHELHLPVTFCGSLPRNHSAVSYSVHLGPAVSSET